MKYFVYKDPEFLMEMIIVFPKVIEHKRMAQILGVTDILISAGFVTMNDCVRPPYCYGESVSLCLGNREKDTELLHKYLMR